jgi:hypothetical protein
MPRRSSHPFDVLAARFAQVVADRLTPILQRVGPSGPGRPPGRVSKLKGRKLDMRCRHPGCKNTSKGPRFSFLCEQHLKLPKAEQKAALAKWEKNHPRP